MPHDKNGAELAIGDKVTVEAVVKEIQTGEEYCNVSLETSEPMHPAETKTPICLNTRQVVKLVLMLILAVMLTLGVKAQDLITTNGTPTIGGPGAAAISFLSRGSNWMTAPYAIIGSGSKLGAGIALGYRLSDYVVPMMRLDYMQGQLWMPSADLQLQAPFTIMGKVTVIPFGFTGLATPISGAGNNNGSAVGLFGAGAAVRLDFLGSGSFWKHTDIVADVEKWSGFSGQQIRFGLLYKF